MILKRLNRLSYLPKQLILQDELLVRPETSRSWQKRKHTIINNLKNPELMKSASTIRKRDTILEIVTWRLLKESLKMKRLLKRSNKLNGQETK